MLRKKFPSIMTGNKAIRERGIETLEWVGLSAVILTLLLGMLSVMPAGGQAIGTQMHSTISNWVEVWSTAGQVGADPGGGSFSPGDTDLASVPPDQQYDPYYGGLDPDLLGTSDPYASSATPNGTFEAACPDCGPNWLETTVKAGLGLFRPGGGLQSAKEASRIVAQDGGKYVSVYKGAPAGLRPGQYLANNPKITSYTTSAGALKKHLTGSSWASAGLWNSVVNAIDYKTGFFNPENKGKPIVSTEFAADVTVDTVMGVASHALAAAAVTATIAAAGITAPAWATALVVAGTTVAVAAGVDWLTCKITGKKATEWAKEGLKTAYNGVVDLANKGMDGVKGLLGI